MEKQGDDPRGLLALPVAVDLDTGNKALTIGCSTDYALAKRGEHPVMLLKLDSACVWSQWTSTACWVSSRMADAGRANSLNGPSAGRRVGPAAA
ncbi:hypothetical protein TNCT6_59350 [Streptomyces sp. 6-11-2]|nr:hypothetical protein TNCT6_59350 [Streptomyces sp. 6-11-2]